MTESDARTPMRGTLDRRDFFRLSLVTPAALLVASGCENRRAESTLARLARVNDWWGEKVISPSRLAPEYDESRRAASLPVYHRSRTLPELTPAQEAAWCLVVDGLVRTPLALTRDVLRQMPHRSYTVKHHCVEGWTAIASWSGVPMATVMEMAGVKPEARYARCESFDSGYFSGWDLATCAHPQTILADHFNGAPLAPDHGAPLRLYSPLKLGYKNIKYLTRISFTDTRPGGYWEDKGYPWLGGL